MGRTHGCGEDNGAMFLCAKHEAPALLAQAEQEKEKILRELRLFYTGDIDVHLYEKRHVMGTSIAATLTVNGEAVRDYDPADLCFLDLNELMLKRMMTEWRNDI